jgi:carbonic anhydrase
MPGGFIRDIVERVTPSVIAAANNGSTATDEVEAEHVRQTMRLIDERSQLIHAAVEEGRCAIVGLTYALAEGNARLVSAIGDIGEG